MVEGLGVPWLNVELVTQIGEDIQYTDASEGNGIVGYVCPFNPETTLSSRSLLCTYDIAAPLCELPYDRPCF